MIGNNHVQSEFISIYLGRCVGYRGKEVKITCLKTYFEWTFFLRSHTSIYKDETLLIFSDIKLELPVTTFIDEHSARVGFSDQILVK